MPIQEWMLCGALLFFYATHNFGQLGEQFSAPLQKGYELDRDPPHVATTFRYWRQCLSCALAETVFFLIVAALLHGLLPAVFDARAMPWLLAVYVLVLPAVPGWGAFRDRFRYAFQRHSFIPPLPTHELQQIQAQLEGLSASFDPDEELLKTLLPDDSVTALSDPDPKRRALAQLELLLNGLEKAQQQQYFRYGHHLLDSELHLLRRHWQQLRRGLQRGDLQSKDIHCLWHASTELISDLVLRNHHTREARQTAFAQFGLRVNVDSAGWFNRVRFCLRPMLHLLPAGKIRRQLGFWLGSERRHSPRYYCFAPVHLWQGEERIRCRRAVLSVTGAAIEANCTFNPGQEIKLAVERFGTLSGRMLRQKNHSVCVTFDLNPAERERLRQFLYGQQNPLAA